jgi:hypothetical protein
VDADAADHFPAAHGVQRAEDPVDDHVPASHFTHTCADGGRHSPGLHESDALRTAQPSPRKVSIEADVSQARAARKPQKLRTRELFHF